VIALGPALEEFDEASGYFDDDLILDDARFKEVCKVLHAVYRNPEASTLERRRALEASVRAPQPWHDGAIRAAYQDDDVAWRVTAVFCMGLVHGFEGSIMEALKSDVPEIRYEAVVAAGDACVSDSADTLVGIAADDDADRDLRMAAILALPNVAGSDAAGILDDLTNHPDEEIAEAADEAFGEILVWQELEAMETGEAEGFDDEEDDDLF
jgi:hypothetical protein